MKQFYFYFAARLQVFLNCAIISDVKVELEKYRNLKICVAVSGGRDSMALLHYFLNHARDYGITLSALNCDHGIRGAASARDSAFVAEFCKTHAVPLLFFKWETEGRRTENSARTWRHSCFEEALKPQTLKDGRKWPGADAVATAHHLDDNAETVLFNLARGSSLSGLKGISDSADRRLIHPLIACTRAEIDEYIAENNVPYVDDETNFTDDYTRNKIRRYVLPALEEAVSGAAQSIYRFSRLAAEDEEYFERLTDKLVKRTPYGVEIAHCTEKVIFKRAVLRVLKEHGIKDYTSEHMQRLFELQNAETGKKFEFLNITAYKETHGIALSFKEREEPKPVSFKNYLDSNCKVFCDSRLEFKKDGYSEDIRGAKVLKFSLDCIPEDAEIRFMRDGDSFKKFKGGTKKLGDYFTDKKIPVRLRKRVPLVAVGNTVLIVCGVEISDYVKIDDNTQNIYFCIADDFTK